MLLLSRYDEGEATATKEEVDLVAVTKDIVEEILPVLNEKGLQVEFTGEAQTIITTNKSAMTELIRILLDNAMKYTVGKPVITVEAKRKSISHWKCNRTNDEGTGQSDFRSLLPCR